MRDERWSLASAVYDRAEERHLSATTHRRRRRDGDGSDADIAGAGEKGLGEGEAAPGPAAAAGIAGADAATTLPRGPEKGRSSRGLRELRKTAIDATAPTARTYSLALQVI